MKLAIVVQRYGADIGGGSELHARYVAELLAAHAEVRVLTTCARDYVTWRNEFAAGVDDVNGIAVERFPVVRQRDTTDFARRSSFVFEHRHALRDEWAWLESQGPVCPDLVARVDRSAEEFDFIIAFSLRYYPALHAARVAGRPVVIVPTTEREPALGLSIVGSALRRAAAIMYNSPEERVLIESVAGTIAVPAVTVGVGSRIPDGPNPARARQCFDLERPFVVYVGRIDANKGCDELFDYFARYCSNSERPLDLVLVGRPVLPVPDHPRIRHLGYVSDRDKFDVMAAAAALVMPSALESLSMVALEAWALGRPVIANGRCDVLVGQCLRSNGGLYYHNGREFEAVLDTVMGDPALAASMGENGRAYYRREYAWPVIERKYLEMFRRLERDSANRGIARRDSPGWLKARRRDIPPAADLVSAAPVGPVRDHTACRDQEL